MENWNIVLGVREAWGQELPFALSPHDRRHHLYAIGKTGTGKTTLLRNLILQDIAAGHGVGVIDPHGDLANDILEHIPRNRIEDVAYFQSRRHGASGRLQSAWMHPARRTAFGRLRYRERVQSDLAGLLGPRLEYILYAAVAALLDCDNVSLLGVQRMLSDGRYRAWVVKQIKDPMVRSFWVNEFEGYNRTFMLEAIAPIQNKVGQLLMSPHVRNILGQVRSRIDAAS